MLVKPDFEARCNTIAAELLSLETELARLAGRPQPTLDDAAFFVMRDLKLYREGITLISSIVSEQLWPTRS